MKNYGLVPGSFVQSSQENFFRRTLSNGAKLIGENRYGLFASNICIGIPVGSGHDPSEHEGRAHFLEHLLFKTRTNSKRIELKKELIAKKGSTNAETSYSTTEVHCRIPSINLDTGIKYLVELVKRPDFTAYQLGTERKVIFREQNKYHDNPETDISDLSQTSLYHPSFGNLILGPRKNIELMSAKDLLDLWEGFYNPSNFTITYTGTPVDPDALANKLEKLFEEGENDFAPKSPIREIEILKMNKDKVISRRDLLDAHLVVAAHAPFPSENSFAPFQLVQHYLTEKKEDPLLYRLIREDKGLTYQIEGNHLWGRNFGFYSVYLSVDPKKIDVVRSLISQGIDQVQNISSEDFDNIKDDALTAIDMSEIQSEDLLTELSEFEYEGKGAEAYYLRRAELNAVTLEQFREAAKFGKFSTSIITP